MSLQSSGWGLLLFWSLLFVRMPLGFVRLCHSLHPPGLLSDFKEEQHFVRILFSGLHRFFYKKKPHKDGSGVCWGGGKKKKKFLKLIPSASLFVFLLPCLFCRHITNATLAILKGQTVPLDVLQIKVKTSACLAPNIPKAFLFLHCSV